VKRDGKRPGRKHDLAFKLKPSADGQLRRWNYFEYPRVELVLELVVAAAS
jgi:hypothetical protein